MSAFDALFRDLIQSQRRPEPMTGGTMRAAKLDPETPRQWAAHTLASSDGVFVTYRGVLTDDGVVLVTGGGFKAPSHFEYDTTLILASIALDIVRRRPELRLDADELVRTCPAHIVTRLLSSRAWSIDEREMV